MPRGKAIVRWMELKKDVYYFPIPNEFHNLGIVPLEGKIYRMISYKAYQ